MDSTAFAAPFKISLPESPPNPYSLILPRRGGLRVIYYWITHRGHLLLLTVYRKSEVSDLTPNEVRALRALVENLED